ncbi:Gaa1-like protein, partial [Dimargaris cristalligena]
MTTSADQKRVQKAQRVHRVVLLLQRHLALFSALLLSVGLLWPLVFPSVYYSRNTYISENALLPNQAHCHYWEAEAAQASAHRDALVKLGHSSSSESGGSAAQLAYIQLALRYSGFRTEAQRFNYTDSLTGRTVAGTNIHGIWTAPRGDTTEALVLVAPWRSSAGETSATTDDNDDEMARNEAGVGLALSLAAFFRTQPYWSKDIIVLVAEGGEVGVEMWLRGYHGELQPGHASPVTLRSGAIQGALAIEVPAGDQFDSFGLFFEGKNGQLPNLDLLNILVRIAHRGDLPLTLHHIPRSHHPLLANHAKNPTDPGNWSLLATHYQESLRTLLATMAAQATGATRGGHAPFHRYRIDALTIQLQAAHEHSTNPFPLVSVGRLIESTFHSLSNLLEHFHQSFFIYLLPSPWQYISIADFIPPILVVAAGILCTILLSW